MTPAPSLQTMTIADPWEAPAPTPEAEANLPEAPMPLQKEDDKKVDAPATKPPGQPAYGKVMLNQLLITLFPHHQSTDQSP
ncbi:MAG: hypothetical protein F6J87_18370 [Spirulina sp. SIO3F2]|nr:hypothetical protein [Spirulina sp. SIO3F2]